MTDRLLRVTALLSLGSARWLLLGIVGFLLWQSWPALSALGLRFMTDAGWSPAAGISGGFFMGSMLAGSLSVGAVALLVAAPLGVAVALTCTELLPSAPANLLRATMAVMAGLPSVVLGLWGLVSLAPLMAALQPPGVGLLTAALVLALMIVPTVTLGAIGALEAVPGNVRRGAAALGLAPGAVIWHLLLPAARGGIGAALLLALARALGETLVVLMVAGNVVQWPAAWTAPVRTLTANIALELGYAMELHRAALFVSGLLLMLLVGALATAADRLLQDGIRA